MSDWAEHLAAVNAAAGGTGKVVLAHLHPGEVSASFAESHLQLSLYDQAGPQRLFHDNGDGTTRFGYTSIACGAGRIADGRNQAVTRFLTLFPQAEWLLFVDSDMGFEPDVLERLVSVAHPQERPIVGGLCFAAKYDGHGPTHAALVKWVPTIYQETPEGSYTAAFSYPRDSVIEVGASGAALLLIHRSVLETIGESWFDNIESDGSWMGEDFSFCRRARAAGFPIHVHTGARTSHHKDVWFTEDDYQELRMPASAAVSVVIPVKDNLADTRSLISQLAQQGGYSDILIFDNGSTDPEMREWLEGQQVATVFDASEADGVTAMWNAGVNEAQGRHGPLVDVVFLNNDITIGHRFLRRLIRGLRSAPQVMAVCGNYDGRPTSGTVPVQGICARRYDGSGGLAGFAFAVKAEWLATFRFDESMAWWYSDSDLCLSIEKAGGWYGLVSDAACEHLDSPSRPAAPEAFAERIEKDREAFEAKWPTVAVTEVPAAFVS